VSTTLVIDPKTYAQMLAALATLPKKVGGLVVRKALSAWGGVVKRVEVAKAKRGATGLLAKSIKVNVVAPDESFNILHHGKPPRVEVGPVKGFSGLATSTGASRRRLTVAKARKIVAAGGKNVRVRPSRYAHLVEAGIAGKKHITPAPFVEPAAREGAGPGMEALSRQLGKGIIEEAAKLAARS